MSLARLYDCLLDKPPRDVLACTYGFDPVFFEQEILPAIFKELSLSRAGGSDSGYLSASDGVLQRSPMLVLCDGYDGGRQLIYNVAQVRRGGAFHPKLLVLDYGDRLRVLVTSANLTRDGYTSSLELFVFEDLRVGQAHHWAEPLRRFLAGTRKLLGEVRSVGKDLERWNATLARVGHSEPTDDQARLLSTFDGPMLPVAMRAASDVRAIEVVSPFFEGEDGAGVFDQLNQSYPDASGRLFVRAEDADGATVVRGPKEKLEALLKSERWTVQRVRRQWEGDAGDPPDRRLHGKLLVLRGSKRSVAVLGSPNVTRAALLSRPPAGNVELAALLPLTDRQVERLLPQSDGLSADDIRIEPADSGGQDPPSAREWVEEAVYSAREGILSVTLADHAPTLTISYEGNALEDRATASFSRPLRLGAALDLEVDAEDALPGTVPIIVTELEHLLPRGVPANLSLDAFLDILAGSRDPAGEGDDNAGGEDGNNGTTAGATLMGGAIHWRRILRAVAGLERDLGRSLAFPSEVRRLLDGPLGLAGLQERIDQVPDFLPADRAFLRHEARLALRRVLALLEEQGPADGETRTLISECERQLGAGLDEIRARAGPALRVQLDVLEDELR